MAMSDLSGNSAVSESHISAIRIEGNDALQGAMNAQLDQGHSAADLNPPGPCTTQSPGRL